MASTSINKNAFCESNVKTKQFSKLPTKPLKMLTPLLLAGCGGSDDGDDVDPNPLPSQQVAPTMDRSLAEVLIRGGNSHIALAADLDGDGGDEIILHYWTTNANTIDDGTLETQDTLLIYSVNSDRSIENATQRFFGEQHVPLGAASRDISFGDVNGDGKIDMALALNFDDQRILLEGNSETNYAAHPVVLLSMPDGSYSVNRLPEAFFGHTVSVVPNELGKADVVFRIGDDGVTIAYRLGDSGFHPVTGYPLIHNNDSIYFNQQDVDHIFATMYADAFGQEPSVVLYYKNDSNWETVDEFVFEPIDDKYTLIGEGLIETHSNLNQYEVEDYIVMNFVIFEVSHLSTGQGSSVYLAQASGDFVEKSDATDGIEVQEIVTGNLWVALELTVSGLTVKSNFLENQNIAAVGYQNQALDINNDNLLDFVSWSRNWISNDDTPWNPLIYLNNGSGGFEQINATATFSAATDFSQPRGLVGDFDGDNETDAFLFSQNIWRWEDIKELEGGGVILFSAFQEALVTV